MALRTVESSHQQSARRLPGCTPRKGAQHLPARHAASAGRRFFPPTNVRGRATSSLSLKSPSSRATGSPGDRCSMPRFEAMRRRLSDMADDDVLAELRENRHWPRRGRLDALAVKGAAIGQLRAARDWAEELTNEQLVYNADSSATISPAEG